VFHPKIREGDLKYLANTRTSTKQISKTKNEAMAICTSRDGKELARATGPTVTIAKQKVSIRVLSDLGL
jgi:hypothetical protein